MSVAIFVINWNGWQDTVSCLSSIEAQAFTDYRVYVLENGSSDRSADHLSRHLELQHPGDWRRVDVARGEAPAKDPPRWTLVLSGENHGFAGGCNIGIDIALAEGADWVFLLNNDANLETGTLDHLLETARGSGAAIVGSRVQDETGRHPLFDGGRWPGMLFGRAREHPPEPQGDHWNTGYVEGSALLLSAGAARARIAECGFAFDPTLFLYCEDAELSRWVHSRGLGCVMSREARVRHGHSRSSGGAGSPIPYYYLTRNRIRLARGWLDAPQRLLFHAYYLPTRLLLLLGHALRRDWRVFGAVLQGLRDGYRGRGGVWSRHGGHRG